MLKCESTQNDRISIFSIMFSKVQNLHESPQFIYE